MSLFAFVRRRKGKERVFGLGEMIRLTAKVPMMLFNYEINIK